MSSKDLVIKVLYVIFGITIMLTSACNCNQSPIENNQENNQETEQTEEDIEKSRKVFYSLPSPSESAVILKNVGAQFHEGLLNPESNMAHYLTSKSRSLNLGIYLADLSYAALFEEKQITINYMNIAKRMADDLGIPDAIDEPLLNKLEEYQDNKQIVLGIIAETFMNSNSYLNPESAAMVVIGGWVEGLYLATQLSDKKTDANEELVQKILDQHLAMGSVLSLIEKFKDSEEVYALKEDIQKIKLVYDKIPLSVSSEGPDKTPTTKAELDPVIFVELCDVTDDVRSKFIQL